MYLYVIYWNIILLNKCCVYIYIHTLYSHIAWIKCSSLCYFSVAFGDRPQAPSIFVKTVKWNVYECVAIGQSSLQRFACQVLRCLKTYGSSCFKMFQVSSSSAWPAEMQSSRWVSQACLVTGYMICHQNKYIYRGVLINITYCIIYKIILYYIVI